MKPPRSAAFGPVMVPLFILARRGRAFEVIAFVFSFVTIFLLLFESLRPKLRLRTTPPAQANHPPEYRRPLGLRPNSSFPKLCSSGHAEACARAPSRILGVG
jgi:hypothetical protein